MPLTHLDHVNIRTCNLKRLTRFYEEVIGLEVGTRPPFKFPGAWLYIGEYPVVHLVEVEEPETQGFQIEHFAFRAEGLPEFIANIKSRELEHRAVTVPGVEVKQVFIRDPDGNRIEVQFAPHENFP